MKIPFCTYSVIEYKFSSFNEENYIYQKQKDAARVAAPSAEKGDNTGTAEYVNKRLTLDRIGTGFVGVCFCVFEDRDRGWIDPNWPNVCPALPISRYRSQGNKL